VEAESLLGLLILITRAGTMAVAIQGKEVDIPKTIIGTTNVGISSHQVLLGIGVCL